MGGEFENCTGDSAADLEITLPPKKQVYAMIRIEITDNWRSAHPGASIGLLEISGASNDRGPDALSTLKRETEARLQERYAGVARQDLVARPVMSAYRRYYKRFRNTYHVLLQVESIAKKGRRLPNVSPLVDANFIAEVETFVLTAGHDVSRLLEPIIIDVGREGDRIVQMNGREKGVKMGDMLMRDGGGVCCTILNGQDNRSPISPSTNHVLYVAYAPEGVPAEAVRDQFEKIEGYVRLFSPDAVIEQSAVLPG